MAAPSQKIPNYLQLWFRFESACWQATQSGYGHNLQLCRSFKAIAVFQKQELPNSQLPCPGAFTALQLRLIRVLQLSSDTVSLTIQTVVL